MLHVSKQAATEAEAKAILDASRHVQNPFGVPILLIEPKNYARKTFLGMPLPRLGLRKHIRTALNAVLAQCAAPSPAPRTAPGTVLAYEDRGYFSKSPQQIENIIMQGIQTFETQDTDHFAYALPNQSPRISVTFFDAPANAIKVIMQAAMQADQTICTDYPGYDAQHSFMSLWHEHAHSVSGSNEAGAEKVAALMCRYAFEDCSFLATQADMRAVNAVLYYNNTKVLHTYGWPCVEVVDDAIALETPPTWDDIRGVAEKSYDVPRKARSEDILEVGTAFMKKSGLPFLYKDMKGMADTAEVCLTEGAFSAPDQIMIAKRFALAARRLSIGTPAYETTPRFNY